MIKKSVNQHIEEKHVENKTLYIIYKKAVTLKMQIP